MDHPWYELSYASPNDSFIKRRLIRVVENLSGRLRLLPVYHLWRDQFAGRSPRMWNDALDLLSTRLDICASSQWSSAIPQGPLVVIANHPFGIADGLALLALLERIGRPYRLLVNADIMRFPEIQPHALPIDFSDSKKALQTNLRSRAEARRLLQEGGVIAVFPGGAVATAETVFGKAEERPWKQFVARLIQQNNAAVLPVFFEGQNSRLFQWISRISQTLRLSLLVREFGHKLGATINATVGVPVEWHRISQASGQRKLIDELFLLVHRLAPAAADKNVEDLLPRPIHLRHRFSFDSPVYASVRRNSNCENRNIAP